MHTAPTVLVSTLLLTTPAEACHHYSHWYYPTPQRCGGVYTRTTATAPKIWYVEITRPPKGDTDTDRQKGIDKLKQLMQ